MMKRKSDVRPIDKILAEWRLPTEMKGGARRRRSQKSAAKESFTGPYLLDYMRQLAERENVFLSLIPHEMRGEFQLVKYDEGEVTVFCRNANYASYLRYNATEIMGELRSHSSFSELIRIRVCRRR